MSLRWRIFLIYVIILCVSLSAMDIYLYHSITSDYMTSERISNLTQANIIANIMAGYIGRNSYMLKPTIETFSKQVNSRVLFLNRDGIVAIDSSSVKSLEGQRLWIKEVSNALKGISQANIYYLKGIGHVMYTAVPVVVSGKSVGAILLSTSIEDVIAMAANIKYKLIYLFTATGIFITLIGLMMANFITRPLKELTKAANQMSAGNLGYVVNIKRKDEVGHLARAFNDMSVKLKIIDEARKKFVSDASHELKTPIAAIKAMVEPLIYGDADKETYREFLCDINDELDRMARLVNQLLDLTRLEKAIKVEKREADLNKIISNVISDIKPLADAKGISLRGDDRPVIVRVNEDLIYRMVYNLIENSIKYSPEKSEVYAAAGYVGGMPAVIVEDHGEGIEPEILPHIFERFTRGDKARSRKSGGFGLGLAIVKEIADLHDASISVQSDVGKGTRFTVTF
ncbi:sensor histidine kinase [Caldanaerobius polysaccharolyticus]|uniref:sensor histidine kinase n=1 Tax=Caldanaerobius polysaccharolyticus TaxID=44256 RepID=UPI000479C0A7|nr:ATP-binding protein [Caldanaerobius polysaccharolyticus]